MNAADTIYSALRSRRSWIVASAMVVGAAQGCSSSEEPASQPGASQGDEAAPSANEPRPAEWGTAMTDGQILETLAAVDTAEIEQAQLALSRTQNPRVREFANHMVQQHTQAKQQGEQVASAAGATLAEGTFSKNLKTKAAETLQTLQSTDAATFDHAYIMSQIQQHDEVLKLLNERMVPAASAAPVREHATKAQAMVQHHLQQARTIQL